MQAIKAVDGAVVCCDIFGILVHTGIWVDGSIIELKGNGLVRAVSPARFLANRSGDEILIACGSDETAQHNQDAACRASDSLFSYRHYDLTDNNCYRFCWYCLTGQERPIGRFSLFERYLQQHLDQPLSWRPWAD